MSASEMITALEYFIVPQTMWPVGLLCAAIARDKLDGIASRIMNQVEANFIAASKDKHEVRLVSSNVAKLEYCLHQEATEKGGTPTTSCHQHSISCRREYSSIIHPVPVPLQERIISLGKAAFLTVTNDTSTESRSRYHSWAFMVQRPTL